MTATASSAPDAWQEGFDAFDSGQAETANPYAHGTDEHLAWNDGWMEAQRAFTGSDADAHST